jgi:hypothetical protein
VVTLLAANQNVLAQNNDHGTGDPSLGPLDAKIENFPLPGAGVYSIEVTGFNATAGTFEMTLVFP